MPSFRKMIWAVAATAAALAPSAFAAGVYFGGGAASYGGVEISTPTTTTNADVGSSWALGGGFTIPVRWWHGAAVASVELSTDVSFSGVDKELEGPYLRDGTHLKIAAIPIREAAVFGLALGRRGIVKPYVGFGGGVSVVTWKLYLAAPEGGEREIDCGKALKPTFAIPFGCEFRLGSRFGLGPRAEYVIITGDVEGADPLAGQAPFKTNVPDIFLFGVEARLNF